MSSDDKIDNNDSVSQQTRNPNSVKRWIIAVAGMAGVMFVSALLAMAGSDGGYLVGNLPVFVICLMVAFVLQWLFFSHAWAQRSEGLFDLVGSITYITLVWLVLFLTVVDTRSLLLASLITVWALRLGPFLYLRIKQAGEDQRFRFIKTSFPTFLMTWTIQGAWVFITASCALAAMSSTQRIDLDLYSYIGLGLFVFGFAIEVMADQQKSNFKKNPDNANQFICTGLWAWSRHPNYFGEIVLWCGIAMLAYPNLQGWQIVTLISPLWVVFQLTQISGVKMLERRAEKQWGQDPEYQAYKRSTPALLLWPPRKSTS